MGISENRSHISHEVQFDEIIWLISDHNLDFDSPIIKILPKESCDALRTLCMETPWLMKKFESVIRKVDGVLVQPRKQYLLIGD